ncbi:hypothetical protein, unlikely [Trypanosoma brucei gambiense DAL972]|uniref:T. brucei spp.-specific protein n=1 Tax=Trypanosoma brucei gambiense (strain MHOM/CI/86/DAL972) TaxID=679716 RepID=C9ZKX3_TRYB9|nr:hypothetical protein, unlikely [Trypanosoma brucei gambiense DAL972]CBH09981.1 hypothetical protein, unlikely [Trypanosoma brucei gambiense DAL972]|eukprot:XP_011772272.1 hypothetical protein, unlikely [Trypanosoma brucei gambiense DAL972]
MLPLMLLLLFDIKSLSFPSPSLIICSSLFFFLYFIISCRICSFIYNLPLIHTLPPSTFPPLSHEEIRVYIYIYIYIYIYVYIYTRAQNFLSTFLSFFLTKKKKKSFSLLSVMPFSFSPSRVCCGAYIFPHPSILLFLSFLKKHTISYTTDSHYCTSVCQSTFCFILCCY